LVGEIQSLFISPAEHVDGVSLAQEALTGNFLLLATYNQTYQIFW